MPVLIAPGLRARRRAAAAVRLARAAGPHRPRSTAAPLLYAGVLRAGIYGGYFGAAQGVLLIALLGLLLDETCSGSTPRRTCSPGWSTWWPPSCSSRSPTSPGRLPALIAVGSVVGGQVGAKIGRRVPAACCAGWSSLVGVVAIVQIVAELMAAADGSVRRVDGRRRPACCRLRRADRHGAAHAAREPAEGLFIAEGEKVIRRALAAGYRMRSMLLEEKWLPAMRRRASTRSTPRCTSPGVDVLEAGDRLPRAPRRAGRDGPPAAAARRRAAARRPAASSCSRTSINHTNIGAVFRSRRGARASTPCSSRPRCADPLYRRSVKVSMGAVFAVPWARLTPWPGGAGRLRDLGFTVLALTPDRRARVDRRPGPEVTDRAALLLGAEGPGLSAAALDGRRPGGTHPDVRRGRLAQRRAAAAVAGTRSAWCSRAT